MKIKETLITLCALTLLAALAYLWLAPAGMKHSPDISLTTIKGEKLQLASYHGRPVLVTFWATTCPGCIKEMPHLIELYEELHPRGFEIISIAMDYDPPNQVLAMSKARDIPYHVALDIHAEAARAFGDVRLTPTSFLIAPDGRIVYQKIGEMNMARIRQDILDMLDARPTAGSTQAAGQG
ncbi:MAG TPA: TlpA disulfide reductase family protein [Gammaproteobacteria bacterium]|jgi:peroxiredoxin|nr:TlpA disulfide reductase family protein [Gammaproteobacteria bacterium]